MSKLTNKEYMSLFPLGDSYFIENIMALIHYDVCKNLEYVEWEDKDIENALANAGVKTPWTITKKRKK